MAKLNRIKEKEKRKSDYPSDFGSHSSMIDEGETAKLMDQSRVVLKDEWGFYETDRNRLDTRTADPNRYNNKREGCPW